MNGIFFIAFLVVETAITTQKIRRPTREKKEDMSQK